MGLALYIYIDEYIHQEFISELWELARKYYPDENVNDFIFKALRKERFNIGSSSAIHENFLNQINDTSVDISSYTYIPIGIDAINKVIDNINVLRNLREFKYTIIRLKEIVDKYEGKDVKLYYYYSD